MGAPDKQPDIHRMPKFLPYVEKILGCNIAQQDLPIEFEKIQLPSPIRCQAFLQQLERDFRSDQISQKKTGTFATCLYMLMVKVSEIYFAFDRV